MRSQNLAAAAVLLVSLAGCASTAGSNTYVDELRELSDSCEARGGILVPTGQQSGRPQTDNVCRISGGASRLTTGG